jgi:hypothetical protein
MRTHTVLRGQRQRKKKVRKAEAHGRRARPENGLQQTAGMDLTSDTPGVAAALMRMNQHRFDRTWTADLRPHDCVGIARVGAPYAACALPQVANHGFELALPQIADPSLLRVAESSTLPPRAYRSRTPAAMTTNVGPAFSVFAKTKAVHPEYSLCRPSGYPTHQGMGGERITPRRNAMSSRMPTVVPVGA